MSGFHPPLDISQKNSSGGRLIVHVRTKNGFGRPGIQ